MNYYGFQNFPTLPQQTPLGAIDEGLKILYGVIGGIQTIIHFLSSMLDIYYFGKEFKRLIIDTIISIAKILLSFFKYIITFRWVKDIGKGLFIMQKKISNYTNSLSKIYIRIGIILILITLIYHKKKKESALLNKNINNQVN